MDPVTGRVPPFAPTVSNPFTGFILPGAGASGINIIDPRLQNPKVQQVSLGVERQLGLRQVVRVDVVHNHGNDFIIGRTVGTVFNPVVGGPDRVVNLESSAKTDYDALLVELERRFSGRFGFRVAYTLAAAYNYANDDQIPFGERPDRSQRSAPRVRPGAQRSAAPARCFRCRRSRRPLPALGLVDACLRSADGHPDAERPDADSRHSTQCRRPVVRLGGRLERVHSAASMPAEASTGNCCHLSPTLRASMTRSTRWTSGSRDRSRQVPFASMRWQRCSTCSTSRTSWAPQP